jgi:5-methyltetrahydrofolate--homocysteine methyltransferase
MISPDMFRRWVTPLLIEEARRFRGRSIYHLDGPGQLVHVPELCAIDGLFGVQWVPGAGNKPELDESHYGLYRVLLDAGKRVCLGGIGYDPDGLRRLFTRFPAREFCVPMVAGSAEEAADMERAAGSPRSMTEDPRARLPKPGS